MGARYMCGTLDIGETRFNDVPFVPSQDCANWESCREEAYKQGRKDQGELNADTIREIHELVYQQGIEKGRKEVFEELFNELHVKEFIVDFTIDQCRREGNRYYLNATTDFNIVLEYLFSMYLEQIKEQSSD